MSIFGTIREAARKRALYNQTVSEIRAMPQDVAKDLGIYPGDAHSLAKKAVYGR